MWFHVKYDRQKNLEISTPWSDGLCWPFLVRWCPHWSKVWDLLVCRVTFWTKASKKGTQKCIWRPCITGWGRPLKQSTNSYFTLTTTLWISLNKFSVLVKDNSSSMRLRDFGKHKNWANIVRRVLLLLERSSKREMFLPVCVYYKL